MTISIRATTVPEPYPELVANQIEKTGSSYDNKFCKTFVQKDIKLQDTVMKPTN